MPGTDANAAKWEELHKDWVFANQAARKARLEATAKFAACARGSGAGPSDAELEEVEQLERAADEAALAESAFLRQVFG